MQRFALNHIAQPSLDFAGLVKLAKSLGMSAVEIRNDLPGTLLLDGTDPARVRELAEEAGVKILSINALQRFNHWTPGREIEARQLATYAKACGAAALVLVPVNDAKFVQTEEERQDGLRAALRGLALVLSEAGLTGLVEPLGFAECSLRLKSEAVAAIEEVGRGERFKLVHDTFHHHLAGETQLFAERTGLVHISGVEESVLSVEQMRDPHRVLVGPRDRLGNLAQLQALIAAGYAGPLSFEPFAESVQQDVEIEESLRISMRWIEEKLAD